MNKNNASKTRVFLSCLHEDPTWWFLFIIHQIASKKQLKKTSVVESDDGDITFDSVSLEGKSVVYTNFVAQRVQHIVDYCLSYVCTINLFQKQG